MLQGKLTYVGIAQLVASLLVLSPVGQAVTAEELTAFLESFVDAVAVVMAVVGTAMSIWGRLRIAFATYRNEQ